jgi:hypothetical protein
MINFKQLFMKHPTTKFALQGVLAVWKFYFIFIRKEKWFVEDF